MVGIDAANSSQEKNMSTLLKALLAAQRGAARAGLIIKRANYYSSDTLRLLRALEVNRIDTVLDVGANKGNYARSLIEGGFKGKIYSFEALPDMHEKLVDQASASGGQWIIAPRGAISDAEGTAKFNITSANSASSLLAPSDKADGLDGIFAIKETISVPTTTLTDSIEELGIKSERIFLKLDIQGGEERALIGAEPIMPQILGLVAEMPLQEYYEGQASMKALDTWIIERGFDLWDLDPEWRDPSTGRLNHINATYFKPTM